MPKHCKESDFIGKTFTTVKGGVIAVRGTNGLKGNKKRYLYDCSICSKDKELFPEYFSATKTQLTGTKKTKPSFSCGCTHVCWSESQYEVRVSREAKKNEYIFHGWYGDFKGELTRLRLYNPATDNSWATTNIKRFLRGSGDPIQGYLDSQNANRLEDKIHIESFIKAGFHKDDKFTRNAAMYGTDGGQPYWNFICHKCSVDEYTKHGLCSGVFITTTQGLKGGSKPCRCSDKYIWSQEQREYKIGQICKEEGLLFFRLV